MANTEKIKQSAKKTTKLRASNLSYTKNFNTEKVEQLLTLWVVDLIRLMDTSGVSLKEYWKDYNILKAIDNTKMAWEEITVPCMKGLWHKIGPRDENFDNLDMLIKEVSEIA